MSATGGSRRHFLGMAGVGAGAFPVVAGSAQTLALAPTAGDAHPPPGSSVLDVTRFGASGDGRTLCTGALQKAIDACGGRGGGVVLIPAGRYLSGALMLRSRVNLHLA